MEDFEQLTEEEVRAAKRRKMAARERRRKKRRQEAIIRCSILLIIVILLLIGIIKGISGIFSHFHEKKVEKQRQEELLKNPPTEEPTTEAFTVDEAILAQPIPETREEAVAILEQQAETDPDIKNILENSAVYSDRVFINLAANPELKQFTLDYVTKINPAYDGDFTMDVATSAVPFYIQYDPQWGYADYGKSLLGYDGSAPTCVAMVYNYLKQDGSLNPIRIGDAFMDASYVDENNATSWEAFTKGVAQFGLMSDELSINEGNMKAALEDGRVIICCMSDGDFIKDKEHYIVITGYKNERFTVYDPSSVARSNVAWPFDRINGQIKNMWAFAVDPNYTAAPSADEEDTTTNEGGEGETEGTNDDGTNDSTDNTDTSNEDGSADNTNGGEN